MANAERLNDLIAPIAAREGFELVRLRLTGNIHKTLQVMAERPNGTMTVDDCARLSRAISEMLDADDPIDGEYDLEVSSPGIDRPLTRAKDFIRFAGHTAKIELVAPDAKGRRRHTVDIVSADETTVTLALSATESLTVPFSAIGEAKLVITDRLLDEARAAQSGLKH